MTKRTIKKVARRYLDGVKIGRYIRGIYVDLDGRDCYEVAKGLRRAIYAEAYRRGYDGCHWDDPMVVKV